MCGTVVYNRRVMVTNHEHEIDEQGTVPTFGGFPLTELELVDGSWVVFETGEYVGEALPEGCEVRDAETFEAAMERIFNAAAAADAEAAKYDAILAARERAMKRANKKKDWLVEFFGPQLRLYAKTQLKGKSRTHECAFGGVSFKTKPGGVRVKDAVAALNYARIAAPDAIEIIPPQPQQEVFKISKMTKEQKEALEAAMQTEAAEKLRSQGFDYVPTTEAFEVFTSIEKAQAAAKKAAKAAASAAAAQAAVEEAAAGASSAIEQLGEEGGTE